MQGKSDHCADRKRARIAPREGKYWDRLGHIVKRLSRELDAHRIGTPHSALTCDDTARWLAAEAAELAQQTAEWGALTEFCAELDAYEECRVAEAGQVETEVRERVQIGDIELRMTARGCPEQYDAYQGAALVGYLRLRYGAFRVDYPDCGGETIYEASPAGDGCFDDDERDKYLRAAVSAIKERIAKGATPCQD